MNDIHQPWPFGEYSQSTTTNQALTPTLKKIASYLMCKCVLSDEDHTASSREMSPSFTMGRDSPVVIEAQDMEESQRRGNFSGLEITKNFGLSVG